MLYDGFFSVSSPRLKAEYEYYGYPPLFRGTDLNPVYWGVELITPSETGKILLTHINGGRFKKFSVYRGNK